MSSIIEKIGLLLRQAEGASTQAEADAYTAKAQSLASLYQVDEAVARQAIAHREKREEPGVKNVFFSNDLGKKNDKHHLIDLYGRIASANDVKNNIYSHGNGGVQLFGFPSDIEVVEVLFGSLAFQMVEAGNAYIRKGEYKGQTEYREKRVKDDYWGGYTTQWGEFPVDGRTARANFYQGWISEVSKRLREARREALAAEVTLVTTDEETGVETATQTTGALVLASKSEEVHAYHKATSKAKGTYKGSSAGSGSVGRSAGQAAGANARLTSTRSIGSGPERISA